MSHDRDKVAMNVQDLRHLLEIHKRVEVALLREGAVLFDAELTVFDETGSYLLGTVFWDPETDAWRLDPRAYGKADRP